MSSQAAVAAPPSHDQHAVSPGEIAIGVVIGRLSEFFDFFVYGLASVLVFPKVFFPFVSPLDGMFYSFAVFSLAFVSRPVGSMLFRVIYQWFGRGTKLTVALFALGTSTVGMAFLPGYADIGSWAIAFLIILRVAQGMAVGGTWDGLPSLLALNAPANRRGWYAMISQLGAPIAYLIAAGLFAYLLASIDDTDFLDWGWRYPFYVAFAINVVALFARLRMVVTPEFSELLRSRELVPSPIGELFRTQGINVFLGAIAPLSAYALFHLVTIFPVSWVELFTGLSPVRFLLVQCGGAVVAIAAMMASGVVADRIGRPRTLAIGAALTALFCGLIPVLMDGRETGAYAFIIYGFGLLGFTHAQAAGAVNSSFAPRFRYSGALLTSDLGWLFGAGFAPLVALWLAAHFGIGAIGLYLFSGAIGTMLALRWNHRLVMRADDA